MNELGPLFTYPGDLIEAIPGYLPMALALAAVALASWILIRRKVGEGLMTAGLVTLPVLAFALSDAVLLERSKKTEFCVSCHLMEPLLETARPEDPESLASIHIARGAVPVSKACYTCHSGYGLLGTVDAKIAGVRHMLLTVTGTHSVPLEIHGRFDINSCLSCHAESARFRDQPSHQARDIQDLLLAGDMNCTDCHVPAHSPEAIGAAE